MATNGTFARKRKTFCWDQLESSCFCSKTILDETRNKKGSKCRKRRRFSRNNVSETVKWLLYFLTLQKWGGNCWKTPELTQNCQKCSFLPISHRIAVRKKNRIFGKVKHIKRPIEKTSLTSYKWSHRWNTTSWNHGFWKMSTCTTHRPGETDNSALATMSSTTFLEVIPKSSPRLKESTLKLDLGTLKWPQMVLLQEKRKRFVETSWRAHVFVEKPFWMNHETKKARNVVSGQGLHGITSLKRWNDYYVFSLWRKGEKVVKKRLS